MDTRETTARAQSQPKLLFRQVRETIEPLEAEVNIGPKCVFARVLSLFLKRLQSKTLFWREFWRKHC